MSFTPASRASRPTAVPARLLPPSPIAPQPRRLRRVDGALLLTLPFAEVA